jgi:putative phage-type endonuclease
MSNAIAATETDAIVLPDRAAWLEWRAHHIGGSEVAAILGENPYLSAFELWARKTGEIPTPEVDSEAALWGKILEAPIAEEYARRTGRKLVDPGPFTVRQHRTLPFVGVTLDREILDEQRGPGVFEAKTTNFFAGKSWREGAPIMPQIQLHHGLAVTGWTWGSVVCLVAGQTLEHVDLERNEDMVDMIEDRCAWFWDLVERKEPPPIDASESTERAIKALHPKDSGARIMLPADAAIWARELEAAKQAAKAAEEMKRAADNKLRAAIGGASFGDLPDGTGGFSLLTTERAGYTVESTTYRTLRAVKAKAAKTTTKGKKGSHGTAEAE